MIMESLVFKVNYITSSNKKVIQTPSEMSIIAC